MENEIYAGMEITLNNTPVYPRYCINAPISYKSGTFYIWNDRVLNNKVRITNDISHVNIPGYSMGWVSISDFLIDENIKIGDKVLVKSSIFNNPEGNGNNIIKNNEIMYIISIKDGKEFPYGVATSTKRTIQGWTNRENLEKI